MEVGDTDRMARYEYQIVSVLIPNSLLVLIPGNRDGERIEYGYNGTGIEVTKSLLVVMPRDRTGWQY